MYTKKNRQLTGILLISGALLINIPYTLLIMNFNYPDILREPVGDILVQFQAGGNALIFTWLLFAWISLPLFFGILMLRRTLSERPSHLLDAATALGIIAFITQVIGLLRWVFVVPVLANMYTDPTSSEATLAAVEVVFQAIHQYGGVVMGEHIGQLATIGWLALVSVAALRDRLFSPWLAWLGLTTSVVYLLNQTDLFATVIPGFPVVAEAGLVGSLLWLLWVVLLGISLLVKLPETAVLHPQAA